MALSSSMASITRLKAGPYFSAINSACSNVKVGLITPWVNWRTSSRAVLTLAVEPPTLVCVISRASDEAWFENAAGRPRTRTFLPGVGTSSTSFSFRSPAPSTQSIVVAYSEGIRPPSCGAREALTTWWLYGRLTRPKARAYVMKIGYAVPRVRPAVPKFLKVTSMLFTSPGPPETGPYEYNCETCV